MHMPDRDRAVKILSCPAVAQPHLAVPRDRHSFPELSVLPVLRQIVHHFRQELLLVFCLKLLPLEIDIVICKVECVHDIQLIRAVKHGCGNVESKCLCRQGEMDLEHLSNVHTGRHAERVQHDIKRTPVRQIRHILHRKHTRDNTLVAVTSSHLITNGDLSFLCDIDAHCLVHSGCKLRVAVRP